MSDHSTETATDTFIAHRNLLFTIAYEMLGSAADAEDVLQETWLRWVKTDTRQVRDPRAYLVRTTTRQALNRLRTLKRRREAYIGPWLPEPLLTAPDVAEDVELAESVSIALMIILERLTPTERAVFVTAHPTTINGNPALAIPLNGHIDGVMALNVQDTHITGLYYVRNPHKLTRLHTHTPLTLR